MELSQLLDFFINQEDIAISVYQKIRAIDQGELGKMAENFIQEEYSHGEMIRQLKEDVQNKNITVKPELIYLLKNELVNTRPIINSRKDMILYALQLEKDSLLIYSQLRKSFTEDSDGYRLFKNLEEQEEKHMYYILKILHSMG